MANVTFWGKPGCAGNARQIALLRASGHMVEVRDLLTEPWTKGRLRQFFGSAPVGAWFNLAAPRVKSGNLRPETLSESDAIAALIAEPLLIRRPLLASEGRLVCGFDQKLVDGWIGLTAGLPTVAEGCVRPDMAPCATPRPSRSAHQYLAAADCYQNGRSKQ